MSQQPIGQQSKASRPRVAVIQDGARRHYVVPVALQRAGALERMFVEWYSGTSVIESAVAAVVSPFNAATARRMRARFHPELDPARIIHNPSLVLQQQFNRRRFDSSEKYWAWVAEHTGKWILRRGFGTANAVYGYIRNVDPELWRKCIERGLYTVGDQIIAPAAIEREESQIQSQRFPGWETTSFQVDFEPVIECEQESWAALDRITCGSQYVADGLVRQGVRPQSITMIPYAPSGANLPMADRSARSGPLTVGFVGGVSLRKGIPYFLQTARRFDPKQVRFVLVGPVILDQEKLQAEQGNVEIIGAVPRPDVARWLQQFDILLFPSTCEGCAGSVLEAMETGLPVISTPNSGTIIRDGIDGYLRRYDDIDAFEQLIRELAGNEEKRLTIGRAARKHVEQLNMEWFTNQLIGMFDQLLNGAIRDMSS